MRKVIISSLVAIAAMSSVCYTTKTSVESSSTLTLANIEALAYNESGYDDCCMYTGDKDDMCFPDSGPILYCYIDCWYHNNGIIT